MDDSKAPFAPFEQGPEHQRLTRIAGRWTGTAHTWMEPGKPPLQAPWEGEVQVLFGGRYIRFAYHSSLEGTPFAGELVVGYHRSLAEWTAAWIDSFHVGTDIMRSAGSAAPGAPIGFLGSYFITAEQPRWGWRTEIHDQQDGVLLLRMFNIAPDGQEYPAIEVQLHRA